MSTLPEHVARTERVTDYKALIERLRALSFEDDWPDVKQLAVDARTAVEALLAIEQRLTDHIVQLAAQRDALRAENEKLRRFERYVNEVRATGTRIELGGVVVAPCNQRGQTPREAELDSMTTEWSAPDAGSIEPKPFDFGYGTDEEMARRAAASLRGPVYKRLVGPWVEVSE